MMRGLVTEVVEGLEGLEIAASDRARIEVALGQLTAVSSWIESLRVRCARRLEELSEAAPLLPEQVLADAGRLSGRDARHTMQQASTLTLVPELEAALAAGAVTAAHVDVVSRAFGRLDHDQRASLTERGGYLSTVARSASPEQFANTVKQLVNRIIAESGADTGVERFEQQRRATTFRHWTDRESGMVCVHGEFDPETGLRLVSRLEATVEAMFHSGVPSTCPSDPERRQSHLRGLALVSLIDSARPAFDAPEAADVFGGEHHNGTHNAGRNTTGFESTQSVRGSMPGRAEITVLIDLHTLQHGLHAHSVVEAGHGVELPVATVRRMACEAGIIPVVLGGDGVALDVGRERRLATAAQRRALRAMYPTCAIPGCTVKFEHTVPHHLRPWEAGGGSDLANLLPACDRHHHAVHEGGWKLHLDAHTRELSVTLPDGTVLRGAPRVQGIPEAA